MFRGDQKTLNKSRHWEESIGRGHDTDHKSASGMRLRGACFLTCLNGLLWKNKSLLQNLFCPVSGLPGQCGPFFFPSCFPLCSAYKLIPSCQDLANTLASLPPYLSPELRGSHSPHRDGCHMSTSWGVQQLPSDGGQRQRDGVDFVLLVTKHPGP